MHTYFADMFEPVDIDGGGHRRYRVAEGGGATPAARPATTGPVSANAAERRATAGTAPAGGHSSSSAPTSKGPAVTATSFTSALEKAVRDGRITDGKDGKADEKKELSKPPEQAHAITQGQRERLDREVEAVAKDKKYSFTDHNGNRVQGTGDFDNKQRVERMRETMPGGNHADVPVFDEEGRLNEGGGIGVRASWKFLTDDSYVPARNVDSWDAAIKAQEERLRTGGASIDETKVMREGLEEAKSRRDQAKFGEEKIAEEVKLRLQVSGTIEVQVGLNEKRAAELKTQQAARGTELRTSYEPIKGDVYGVDKPEDLLTMPDHEFDYVANRTTNDNGVARPFFEQARTLREQNEATEKELSELEDQRKDLQEDLKENNETIHRYRSVLSDSTNQRLTNATGAEFGEAKATAAPAEPGHADGGAAPGGATGESKPDEVGHADGGAAPGGADQADPAPAPVAGEEAPPAGGDDASPQVPPAKTADEVVRERGGLGSTHVVRPGQYLEQIANEYNTQYGTNVTYAQIHAANRSTIGPNPDLIYPGQAIVIPGVQERIDQEVAASQAAHDEAVAAQPAPAPGGRGGRNMPT